MTVSGFLGWCEKEQARATTPVPVPRERTSKNKGTRNCPDECLWADALGWLVGESWAKREGRHFGGACPFWLMSLSRCTSERTGRSASPECCSGRSAGL